jgi:hypothetical protein
MSSPPEWHISPVAMLHLSVIRPLNRAFLPEPTAYATAHLSLMLRFLASTTVPTADDFEAAVHQLGDLINAIEPRNAEHRAQLQAAGRQLEAAVRAGRKWLGSGEET